MTTGEAGLGQWWSPLTLVEHVAHYESRQLNRKEAMKSAATDRGLSRRDVYQALLDASDE
jgi:16S rRNA (cytidine1402-2'-O)-methyltransferase